jgi:hypothetical protein
VTLLVRLGLEARQDPLGFGLVGSRLGELEPVADHWVNAGGRSRGVSWGNLGNTPCTRFELTGHSADLDEAITVGREAPRGPAHRTVSLH